MSHLTLLDTQLRSFQYLQKSLKRISKSFTATDNNNRFDHQKTEFLQGKLANRVWNNFSVVLNYTPNGYSIIMDKELFGANSSSNVNVLLENITQNYAIEAIIGESTEIGFEPLSYKQNLDGSKTIVLERICE